MSYAYRLCALKVESDFDLPELTAWDGLVDSAADVVIRRGEVPSRLAAPDHVAPIFQTRGDTEYLLSLPGSGRVLVRRGAEVTVDLEPAANATDARAIITSSILAVLWHQRGLLPLHASVVATHGRALALAGPAASGKSTLAAMMSARGHCVVADDVCVVDARTDGNITVLPVAPHLRLWRDTLDHLGIRCEGLLRMLSAKEQFLLDGHASDVREPQRLAAVVVLSRRPGGMISIARHQGALAVGALRDVVHTRSPARALGRDPEIFAALTRLATNVTVWRLRVPDDPACLDDAVATALGALEA
jgi:hypothetical protein